MNNLEENFDSISPYKDEEVSDVIKSLTYDKRFHDLISAQIYPSIFKIIPGLSSFLFRKTFIKSFGNSKSIEQFQNNLAPFVEEMIKRTTDGFSYSGSKNLSSRPTLYISNHRDIALDSLFLNFARFKKGQKTVRIAIGDNLLDSGFFEKLMRLNKSFVVHRNIKGVKETLTKLANLSRFINHSLIVDQESIWIAQSQGRAIDGHDFTDPAVLKMLYLSSRKSLEINEWVKQVNLTPVSISYEYDPLDIIKAIGWEGWEELSYEENNQRDLGELVKGIKEPKGRVHLHIGKNICEKVKNIEDLAKIIDQEIISNYKLWPSNYISAHALGCTDRKDNFEGRENFFLQRFKTLDPEIKKKALEMYSAPFQNQKKEAR